MYYKVVSSATNNIILLTTASVVSMVAIVVIIIICLAVSSVVFMKKRHQLHKIGGERVRIINYSYLISFIVDQQAITHNSAYEKGMLLIIEI